MKHKKLKLLYQMDELNNYKNKYVNDAELAEFISKNFHSMSEEEMKHVALKCLNENGLKGILLEYEMKNLQIKPIQMQFKQFVRNANKILNRYQCKAGGFLFGNEKWKIHDYTSKKYYVKENEICFENSISVDFMVDSETISYLQNILKILNSIAVNISVSCHEKFSNRDKIFWIIFKCRTKE
jgi:hypothetical protein